MIYRHESKVLQTRIHAISKTKRASNLTISFYFQDGSCYKETQTTGLMFPHIIDGTSYQTFEISYLRKTNLICRATLQDKVIIKNVNTK